MAGATVLHFWDEHFSLMAHRTIFFFLHIISQFLLSLIIVGAFAKSAERFLKEISADISFCSSVAINSQFSLDISLHFFFFFFPFRYWPSIRDKETVKSCWHRRWAKNTHAHTEEEKEEVQTFFSTILKRRKSYDEQLLFCWFWRMST